MTTLPSPAGRGPRCCARRRRTLQWLAVLGLSTLGAFGAAVTPAASATTTPHPARPGVAGVVHAGALRVGGPPVGSLRTAGGVGGGIGATRGLRHVAAVRQTDTNFSTNWSGLGGTGSGIQGAAATWTVPAVRASSSARYSSTWVGVDGMTDRELIQVGVAQDSSDGYWAWYELLPADATRIRAGALEPGDAVAASVVRVGPGRWQVSIEDTTHGWSYTRTVAYSAPGRSAEWVEEAPTVDNEQSSLADFGKVQMRSTRVYGDFGPAGTAWYPTGLTAGNEIDMLNAARTRVIAAADAPAPPAPTGQRFTDTYVTAPSTPTDLRATARVDGARLAWDRPASTGGTAIAFYDIRVFRNGALRRTVTARSTATTVAGLTARGRYRFEVAAHSSGGHTSAYTRWSSLVRPEP